MDTKTADTVKNITIFQILWGGFLHRIHSRMRTWRLPVPERIGAYRLVRTIEKANSSGNQYQFGIYKDAAGKQLFAKQWSGLVKNIEYFWLFNEIEVYRVVNMISAKEHDSIIKKFPHIHVPRLIATLREESRLLLLTEHVEGKDLELAPQDEGIRAMEEAAEYFMEISGHITPHMLRSFIKRGFTYIVGNFFVMFIRAAVRNPKIIPSLARALVAFTMRLRSLFKTSELKLVHRDITYFNILFQKEKLYLIDYELSVLTHPLFEITQIITGAWRRKGFWEIFYASDTMKKIFAHKTSRDSYWALTLYTAFHRMATCPRKEFNLHYSYLRHALEYPKTQEKKS